jgi:acetoin utilization deacetylase AcuC-like enzyme
MTDRPTNTVSSVSPQTPFGACYLHELFGAHDPGPHPDQPARYDAVRRAVDASGVAVLEAPAAGMEAIARVHDRRFAEWLERVCAEGGGMLDPDTVVGPSSFEAARRACGGAIAGVDLVIDGGAAAAFVGGRPPGHHAERARAMGFCILNAVAVAVAHARSRGVERVAVLDWDVHHGNGTQATFWDDPAVLYVSLHQYGYGFFPGTGGTGERGGDGAPGATVNVPLAAGTGERAYLEAFHGIALPALRDHRPDLLLVSAGFDAHAADPLGSLGLGEEAFVLMRDRLGDLGAPQVYVLEGGYDLGALERSVAAVLGR